MKQTAVFEKEQAGLARGMLLRPIRPRPYGSVQDLDDDELADPDELERQVYLEEFGPILALPVRGRKSQFRPSVDETGVVDWGAFGTVDFERTMPQPS
jgi:hypothetical protein